MEIACVCCTDGYIRVWDINHYCVDDENDVELPCGCEERWYGHFPFVKWKHILLSLGYWQKIFRQLDPEGQQVQLYLMMYLMRTQAAVRRKPNNA